MAGQRKEVDPGEALDEFIAENDKSANRHLLKLQTLWMGIDPGVSGALCVISPIPEISPLVIDIPTFKIQLARKLRSGKKATRSEYNNSLISSIFRVFDAWRVSRGLHVVVCLEKGQPMRRDTPLTSFSVGVGYGMWPLLFSFMRYELETVSPVVWKRRMSLIGKDKEASRAKAMQLWPSAPLWKKKHHNRAEALLIAEYTKRNRSNAN